MLMIRIRCLFWSEWIQWPAKMKDIGGGFQFYIYVIIYSYHSYIFIWRNFLHFFIRYKSAYFAKHVLQNSNGAHIVCDVYTYMYVYVYIYLCQYSSLDTSIFGVYFAQHILQGFLSGRIYIANIYIGNRPRFETLDLDCLGSVKKAVHKCVCKCK